MMASAEGDDPVSHQRLLPQQPSTLASLIAGTIAGASQVLIGQPLDTIKTRSQTAPPGTFSGPLDIALRTLKHEGPLAFYKGTTPPLIGVAGVNALLFTSYHGALRWFVRDERDPVTGEQRLSVKKVAAAGAFAGAVNATLAGPVEMFKVRLQASYGKGVMKGGQGLEEAKKLQSDTGGALRREVKKVWRQHGFKDGIMRGFWITVIREIPAYAAFYTCYELTKRRLSLSLLSPPPSTPQRGTTLSTRSLLTSPSAPSPPRTELPVWALLVSGGIGGLGYWTACYPLDVIKSRIQLADEKPQGRGISYIWKEGGRIWREEGWRAFTRGLSPTYLRAVPAAASTFVAFELSMGWIQKHTNI